MALEIDRNDPFYAIAHPLRRAILESLLEQAQPAMYLADKYDISKPGISQHLKVLKEAGLVSEEKVGRTRFYMVEQEPLKDVHDWISKFEKFWNEKLNNLGAYLKKKHGEKVD